MPAHPCPRPAKRRVAHVRPCAAAAASAAARKPLFSPPTTPLDSGGTDGPPSYQLVHPHTRRPGKGRRLASRLAVTLLSPQRADGGHACAPLPTPGQAPCGPCPAMRCCRGLRGGAQAAFLPTHHSLRFRGDRWSPLLPASSSPHTAPGEQPGKGRPPDSVKVGFTAHASTLCIMDAP